MESLTAGYIINSPKTTLPLLSFSLSTLISVSPFIHIMPRSKFPKELSPICQTRHNSYTFWLHTSHPHNSTQSSKARVRILHCTFTSNPCRNCISGGWGREEERHFHISKHFFLSYNIYTSKRCTPDTTFWYSANHKVHNSYQNKSTPNRCTYLEGLEGESCQLHYLPPKAERTLTEPRDAELQGSPLFSQCNTDPYWGPNLITSFNSSSPHPACAPSE